MSNEYGLIWEDEYPEELQEDVELINIPEKTIIKDYIGTHKNYLVEGENLHYLTHLNKTHKGKVDIIYIDPPYNTGKDFIYNDKFSDKDSTYRQSKWLSFMDKRLRLAKSLLSKDGVIYVSINDTHFAHLKLLMDKIFGESNYLGEFIHDKGNAQNDIKTIQRNHEYILVYGNPELTQLKEIEIVHTKLNKDKYGYWYKGHDFTTGSATSLLSQRVNLGQVIYYKKGQELIIQSDYAKDKALRSVDMNEVYKFDQDLIERGYRPIIPPRKQNKLGRWTWSIDRMQSNKHEIGYNVRTGRIFQKKYVSEELVEEENGEYYYTIEKLKSPRSILTYPSSKGTNLLIDMFGEKLFNYPKNLDLIKYLIKIYQKENALVLDFFAGSGTTGHAVLELNNKDKQERTFILNTINEVSDLSVRNHFLNKGLLTKNTLTEYKKFIKENTDLYNEFVKSDEYEELGICRSITYERLNKVINGYTTFKGENKDGIKGDLIYQKIQ